MSLSLSLVRSILITVRRKRMNVPGKGWLGYRCNVPRHRHRISYDNTLARFCNSFVKVYCTSQYEMCYIVWCFFYLQSLHRYYVPRSICFSLLETSKNMESILDVQTMYDIYIYIYMYDISMQMQMQRWVGCWVRCQIPSHVCFPCVLLLIAHL